MHILLVGPGALGCLLGSVVTRGIAITGDKLTLLDYNRDRADYIARQGIVYQVGEESRTIPVAVVSAPQLIEQVDVILLCVKSYDVATSLAFCRPLLKSSTLVVFLQNGISHLTMLHHLGEATAAFGTTTEGATLLGRGHVRHAGRGCTSLGFLQAPAFRPAQLLTHVHAIFSAGGLQVESADNILTRIWAKLFINVGINALTATLACRNGELLTLPGIDRRMQTAVEEAQRVALAEGIAITNDPLQATRTVCHKTAENVSSMLQDVRNKRRTEIDAINGAVVERGLSFGIDTPENTLLCRQVKEIETGYLQS